MTERDDFGEEDAHAGVAVDAKENLMPVEEFHAEEGKEAKADSAFASSSSWPTLAGDGTVDITEPLTLSWSDLQETNVSITSHAETGASCTVVEAEKTATVVKALLAEAGPGATCDVRPDLFVYRRRAVDRRAPIGRRVLGQPSLPSCFIA